MEIWPPNSLLKGVALPFELCIVRKPLATFSSPPRDGLRSWLCGASRLIPFLFLALRIYLLKISYCYTMLLYKRAFRKEKGVSTFLTKALKCNSAITVLALIQMRRLNLQYSPGQQARYLSLLAFRVQELPVPN